MWVCVNGFCGSVWGNGYQQSAGWEAEDYKLRRRLHAEKQHVKVSQETRCGIKPTRTDKYRTPRACWLCTNSLPTAVSITGCITWIMLAVIIHKLHNYIDTPDKAKGSSRDFLNNLPRSQKFQELGLASQLLLLRVIMSMQVSERVVWIVICYY